MGTTAEAGPYDGMFIPDSEYGAVERRALEGSAEDAFRMTLHFETGFQYERSIFGGQSLLKMVAKMEPLTWGTDCLRAPTKSSVFGRASGSRRPLIVVAILV